MHLKKKIPATIVLLTCALALSAQQLDRDRVLRHLQERWDTVLSRQTLILMDMSYVNNLEGWQKLMATDSSDVMIIRPQVMHDPRSQRYYRLVAVTTKSGQHKKDRKEKYDLLIRLAPFKTSYDHRRSDTMTITQNSSLVINDTVVTNNKEMGAFQSIPFEDILNIDFTGPYSRPFYGPNSRNGVVLIWTRPKKR